MVTEDGALWIVFNGEIFNFMDLRKDLERTGKYVFRSASDTEVLLYAVREWGIKGCLERIRGMYAFGILDLADWSLTLVRDPLGVKPLYYMQAPWGVAFASEIKALLEIPGMSREIDFQSLSHYLTFANAPAPRTMFRGIRKLEAGCLLRIDRSGALSQVRYWDPATFAPPTGSMDERECVEEIRRLLRQAVTRRMVSDVPFGVFLSGGVDSSLNVALMAEMMDRPVQTFSVGIKGDPSNEFLYARKVAQHFGADHHEVLIGDQDFISFTPKMAFYQDEPLADPVCVPLNFVSKLARDSGTIVIQVGEGSDEIFAGYRMYHAFVEWDQKYFARYSQLPSPVRRLAAVAFAHFFPDHLKDALRRANEGEPLFLGNAIAFWDEEKRRLLSNSRDFETSSGFIKRLMNPFNGKDPLLGLINLELKNRLPELLLMRVDKMSMANSIETRVPFLDEDLVSFALRIPSALKYMNGEPKHILKKAAEGIIPDEIIYRKKWGFCGSATNMLSKEITSFAYDKVINSPLVGEVLDREYVRHIFSIHEKQQRFYSFKIWNLLNLALWYDCWFVAKDDRMRRCSR
jgi:asparagine synthase (glutamine-hydrolysing)